MGRGVRWAAFVVCVKLFLGEDVRSCIFKKIDQILIQNNGISLFAQPLFGFPVSVWREEYFGFVLYRERGERGGGFVVVALFNSLSRTAAARSGGIYYVRKIAMNWMKWWPKGLYFMFSPWKHTHCISSADVPTRRGAGYVQHFRPLQFWFFSIPDFWLLNIAIYLRMSPTGCASVYSFQWALSHLL